MTTTSKPSAKQADARVAAAKPDPELASCEECGAPMEKNQRYCVSCGNRRKDTATPSVQYFAASAKRGRRPAGSGRPATQSSGARAAAVIFFVLLPIAVAVGVLVGRGGGDDNKDLIAAINSAAANGASSGGTLASNTETATIASDFTLDKGYTVMLKTLPAEGTDQAAVDAAKAEATKSGATDVGVINPADFTVTPDQGGAYVVYSGEFKAKAEATKALGKLKADFKDAVVLQVTRAAGGEGKVLGKTEFGDVHQVTGFKATPEKVASDQQVVDQISKKIGSDYVGAQKNLPDVIVVGGGGSSGGGGPTGPDN